MHSRRSHLTYSLGTLVMGAALVLVGPVSAENSTTIDQSTQPHLKSWSNIIPNANRRFIVLGDFNNEAVLDRETGLVWEKSPKTTDDDWSSARFACADNPVGGRKGWRLPSLPELASLVDLTVAPPGPTLPPGHPFLAVQSAFFFSATSNAFLPTDVWGVDFGNGNVTKPLKSSIGQAWCVRGPMNADTY